MKAKKLSKNAILGHRKSERFSSAKICPKCHSLHIRARWQSFWFVGFPSTYECLDCSYRAYIFPRVELTKKNVAKLARLRKKLIKKN